jgi:outer membrane protein TolC
MRRIILLAWASVARPQQLDLEALVSEALDRSPEVAAARKQYEAARTRPDQASALPDTALSLGYWSNGRPWPGAGLGREPTSNLGFTVAQEFPAPGKRKLRGDVAAKEAQAEFETYQAAQLAVVSRVKQAYFKLAHSHLVADVLGRNRALLNQLLQIAQVRYTVGKAQQQDLFKAQAQLSIVEAKLIQQRRERAARESELLSLLSRRPTETLEGRPKLPPMVHPTRTLDELFAMAARNSPTLRRDERMIQRGQLALNLARKDYYPDYTVSGGYYNMGGLADMYQFQVTFKLPTSFFRKQRPALAEQTARIAQSRRMLEADSQSIAFRIKDEYLMWETSHRLMKLYEETLVPQSSLALESSLASYETGSVDFLSVLTNFLSILEFEMNYHEEMLAGHLAMARLEELTGLRLTEGRP